MQHTDFSVFRDRLAEACRLRNITHEKLCSSIGIGGRHALDLGILGVRALDVYRLTQIADRLDVSVDWLLGRSNVMNVLEMPELPEPPKAEESVSS